MEQRKTWQIFFACLRFALLKTPIPEETKKAVTTESLMPLYALAKEQNLIHLIGFALKENTLLPKGEKVSAAFEKSILTAFFITERIEKERRALSRFLEEEKIEHVSLKGAVLRHLYPETWMRTSTDADILIPMEKLEAATALLQEKKGYRLLEEGSHDRSFATPSGANMELHFALIEKARMPEAGQILEKAWEYTEESDQNQYEKFLTPEFFLFYHMAHMAKHLNSGGVGIRFFLDLYLIRKKMPVEEEFFSRLAEKGKIATFTRVCENLAFGILEEAPLSPEATLLLDFIMKAGIFGKTETFVAIKRGRKNTLRYFYDRLFPSYEALLPLYPNLAGQKWKTPFYRILRIVRHVKDGGLSRSGKEAAQNLSLSSGKQNETEKLLSSLELSFHD